MPGLGDDPSIKQQSLVWGAACMLWGEPEHVAYAVFEAADVEAVNSHLRPTIPATWTTRVLPVFASPDEAAAVRQFLATRQEPPAEPIAERRDSADVDTLKGVSVAVEPEEEPADSRVTRVVPHPILSKPVPAEPPAVEEELVPAPPPSPEPEPAVPDTSSVTRVVDRRSLLEAANAMGADEPLSPSESSTVILEPRAQRLKGLRLEANAGPAQGSVFHVDETGATLGRLPENSICLTDGRLSRHHARIDFRDDAFWITDLGSQNGTLVNDRPVTEAARLQPGDTVELGTTRLLVSLDSDD